MIEREKFLRMKDDVGCERESLREFERERGFEAATGRESGLRRNVNVALLVEKKNRREREGLRLVE